MSKQILLSPLTGNLLPLEEVPDAVFAQKIVGDGVAIEPFTGEAYAPLKGVVSAVVKGEHALAIKSEDGVEVLIHIGIDTVKMKGEGFKCLFKEGDSVEAGEKILEFDLEKIKERAPSILSPIIITSPDYAIKPLLPFHSTLRGGETPLLEVKRKDD